MNKEIVKTEAVVDQLPAKTFVSPATLKDGFELASVEDQRKGLAEYDARRGFFRKWLLSHLIEGVHYGFPPGCEPKYDADGNILVWSKPKKKMVSISPKQWQPKPSLYKAGALLIVDLLKIKVQYNADAEAWLQMGSKAGMSVIRCTIFDHGSGKEMGQGHGIFEVGQKGMNANAAIKMAEKCALINAVINTIPIMSDLFTQDIEDVPQLEENQFLVEFVATKMSMNKIEGAPKTVIRAIVKQEIPERQEGQLLTTKQIKKVMDAINSGIYALDTGETINA